MEKINYTGVEMLEIAAQHAYCAEYLLQHERDITMEGLHLPDTVLPAIGLLYTAFEMAFRACLNNGSRANKPYMKLLELVEASHEMALSTQDLELLRILSNTYGFHKGIHTQFIQDRNQLLILCHDLLHLYERLQAMLPVELQPDYQS